MRNYTTNYPRYTGRSVRQNTSSRYKEKDFASKTLIQFMASLIIFVLLLGFCSLPYDVCQRTRNEVRYFLTFSYDFKQAAITAYNYITNLVPSESVVPTDSLPENGPASTPVNTSESAPESTPESTPTDKDIEINQVGE